MELATIGFLLLFKPILTVKRGVQGTPLFLLIILLYFDFPRLFGAKCASCRQFFSEHDLVMRARSSIYHVDCFRCVACNRRLIQGDEFCLRDAGLLCRADHDVADATTTDEVSFGNDNDSNDTQFNVFNNNNNNNDTKSKDAAYYIKR